MDLAACPKRGDVTAFKRIESWGKHPREDLEGDLAGNRKGGAKPIQRIQFRATN